MSAEFDPTAPLLTSSQHLARARHYAQVYERASASVGMGTLQVNMAIGLSALADGARMHIELAREVDRQREMILSLRPEGVRKVSADVDEELPEIIVDHPVQGRIRWSWDEVRWMSVDGPQDGPES